MARKLTDIEKKRVQDALNDELDYHELQTPEEWHQFVMGWNWDDGYEPLAWIAEQAQCDRGTALYLYWLAAPRFFCQYGDRDEVESYQLDNYDFVKTIETRYLRGFYKRQEIRFDPTDMDNTGAGGTDLTQEYMDQVQKRPLPQPMFEPSPGEPVAREELVTDELGPPNERQHRELLTHLSRGAAELKKLMPQLSAGASPQEVVDAIRDAVESHRSVQGAAEMDM